MSNKQVKIYCKDCGNYLFGFCNKSKPAEFNKIIGKWERDYYSKYELNKNNDCRYFKLKWWKRIFK